MGGQPGTRVRRANVRRHYRAARLPAHHEPDGRDSAQAHGTEMVAIELLDNLYENDRND